MNKIKISLQAPKKYILRKTEETNHNFRSGFMRDRDRILYCKAFRRLASKTQIFVIGYDDHVRNRLTHTLEVSQIARTISQVLKLDLDLTEAIALGHDLGHTPFGHMGERTLNRIMNECDPSIKDYLDLPDDDYICLEENERGFKHNLQSIRIAIDLESSSLGKNDRGLNLTNFTLFGIKNHSKTKWKDCDNVSKNNEDMYCCAYNKLTLCLNKSNFSIGYFDKYNSYLYAKKSNNYAWSFEAFVVAWADEIAQRHHDIEDAIEGKLISHQDAIALVNDCFGSFFSKADQKNFLEVNKSKGTDFFLPKLSRLIVNFLVSRLVEISIENINNFIQLNSIRNMKDYDNKYVSFAINNVNQLIGLIKINSNDNNLDKAHKKFEKNLRNIVLNSFNVHRMDGKGQYIIQRLFKAYIANPQQLPDKTIISLFREYENSSTQNVSELRNRLEILKKIDFSEEHNQNSMNFKASLLRVICDYIAGMTDSYAIKEHKNLYS